MYVEVVLINKECLFFFLLFLELSAVGRCHEIYLAKSTNILNICFMKYSQFVFVIYGRTRFFKVDINISSLVSSFKISLIHFDC